MLLTQDSRFGQANLLKDTGLPSISIKETGVYPGDVSSMEADMETVLRNELGQAFF